MPCKTYKLESKLKTPAAVAPHPTIRKLLSLNTDALFIHHITGGPVLHECVLLPFKVLKIAAIIMSCGKEFQKIITFWSTSIMY